MEQKNKRMIFLLGTLFVAFIFLSSYAAFNNNNNVSVSTTSTVQLQQSFYSTGYSNAIVANYSGTAYIAVADGTNTIKNKVANLLSQLQANGTVQNYAYSNGTYQAVLSGISAYSLQQILTNKTQSNSIAVGATSILALPPNVTMYYSGQPINVVLQGRNYSVYLSKVKKIGTVLNVSVSGLLTRNGQIYNNQFKVSYSGV